MTTPFIHPFYLHHREIEVRVGDGAILFGTTGWFETSPGELQTILRIRGYWPQFRLKRYQPDRVQVVSFAFGIEPNETALSPGIGAGKRRSIVFPLWLPTIVFGLMTWRNANRAKAQARRHDIEQQSCPHCGYDMRASPNRCSECGWQRAGG